MSPQLEVFTDLCGAGCGRRYEVYHRPCNLVLCNTCLTAHACRTEGDRTVFYPKAKPKKKSTKKGAVDAKVSR